MYTNYRCPAGYWCDYGLETADDKRDCPLGQYCPEGRMKIRLIKKIPAGVPGFAEVNKKIVTAWITLIFLRGLCCCVWIKILYLSTDPTPQDNTKRVRKTSSYKYISEHKVCRP